MTKVYYQQNSFQLMIKMLIRYIIHIKMKTVMLAIMTVCMGGFFYTFPIYSEKSYREGMTTDVIQLIVIWGGLILIAIASFIYACKLGLAEDRAKRIKDMKVLHPNAIFIPELNKKPNILGRMFNKLLKRKNKSD